MTSDDIMKLALDAGIRVAFASDTIDPRNVYLHELKRFATLVAAAEREACAKVCDEHAKRNYNWASENADTYHAQAHWAGRIATAIRARGQE